MHEKYKEEKRFAVVVIDPGERKSAVERFAKEFDWTFDVLLDPKRSVAKRYGVSGHPMHFLIGPSGKIQGVAIGYRDWSSETASQLIDHSLKNLDGAEPVQRRPE